MTKRKLLSIIFIPVLSIFLFVLFLEVLDRIVCSFRFNSARYLAYPLLEKGPYHLPQAHLVPSTIEDSGSHGYYKFPDETAKTGLVDLGISVNSFGFRGKEFLPSKPANTYRVFCTGGSSTFSSECPDGLSYPEQLEAILNKRVTGQTSYEIINAGFDGFRVDHILALLQKEILNYQPDCITVCEAFTAIEDHALVLDTTGKKLFWWMHGIFYQRSLLYSDLVLWMGSRDLETAGLMASSSVKLARYARDLASIYQALQKAKAKLVFILQPVLPKQQMRALTVHSGGADSGDQEYLEREYIRFFSGLHSTFISTMERVAAERSITLVDPRKAFLNHSAPAELFVDYIHLSPGGSRVLAEEIARVFIRDKIGPAE